MAEETRTIPPQAAIDVALRMQHAIELMEAWTRALRLCR
jgi:hypothetical protein